MQLGLSALEYLVINTVTLCTFTISNPTEISSHECEKQELEDADIVILD